MRRIGLLTSGGDAPGMNSAIRAVVRAAAASDIETVGFQDGYDGLIEGRGSVLAPRDVGGIIQRGGTMLRTARAPEMLEDAGRKRALRSISEREIEGLVVIGGDGSLRGAGWIARNRVPTVGIPASIDNDIWGTYMSLGVDTALNTILDAVDKLRDTASSHQRAFLVETMGRDCGYLALMASVACGAEIVVVPEAEPPLSQIGDAIASAYRRGKSYAFVIVAEGAALDVHTIAAHLDELGIGFESRITILGHVQRGGTPSAFDRLLASRMGIAAVDALRSGETAVMTALEGHHITLTPLAEVTQRTRQADLMYRTITELLAR